MYRGHEGDPSRGNNGGYYPAQQQYSGPAAVGGYGNGTDADHYHAQQQQQQHQAQADASRYDAPPTSAEQEDPNAPGSFNSQLALRLCDMRPPSTISSIPPVAAPEMSDLAQLAALAMQHRCEEMRAFERSHQSLFHSSRVPGISVWDYVRRIAKYSGCSPECFVIALILLDRYSQVTQIPLSFRNIHRLSITTLMVSAKLRDDIYYSNAYYASIGGVTAKELYYLEVQLLATIQWSTWVESNAFDEYVVKLRSMYGIFLPPPQ